MKIKLKLKVQIFLVFCYTNLISSPLKVRGFCTCQAKAKQLFDDLRAYISFEINSLELNSLASKVGFIGLCTHTHTHTHTHTLIYIYIYILLLVRFPVVEITVCTADETQ